MHPGRGRDQRRERRMSAVGLQVLYLIRLQRLIRTPVAADAGLVLSLGSFFSKEPEPWSEIFSRTSRTLDKSELRPGACPRPKAAMWRSDGDISCEIS